MQESPCPKTHTNIDHILYSAVPSLFHYYHNGLSLCSHQLNVLWSAKCLHTHGTLAEESESPAYLTDLI